MYEQMRNELQAKLVDSFGAFDIQQILMKLDAIAEHYQITTKETALTVYNPDELPEMVKAYLASCVVAGMSDKTIERKKLLLGLFFGDMRKPPAEVTTNDVRVWLYEYQQRRGVSNRTLDGYRCCVRAFFQWAVNEEYMMRNPVAKIPQIKYEKKLRKELTQYELEQLKAACATTREKAMIDFLHTTACRVSELCVAKKSDIDWNTGVIKLFGKGKKERVSKINPRTMISLKKYFKERTDNSDYIFVSDRKPHGKLTKAAVEKIVKDIAAESGIYGKPVSLHVIRHTTATQMINNGVPVEEIQMFLGHANIATTMIYAHADSRKMLESHLRSVV